MNISYWAYFGILYLGILTYQDYKNNRLVDDRFNAIMLGLTISLMSHTQKTLFYLIALTIVLLILYAVLRKLKPLGEGDINSISWIFYGFGIISPAALAFYVILFVSFTLLYYLFKLFFARFLIMPLEQPTAFYGVILLSYISGVGLWGLL